MNTMNREADSGLIASQIASMYLLKKKTITLSEIKALPFVNDQTDVENLIFYLQSNFLLKQKSIAVQTEPYLMVDTIYKLVGNRIDS
jgi:hypothetical protein